MTENAVKSQSHGKTLARLSRSRHRIRNDDAVSRAGPGADAKTIDKDVYLSAGGNVLQRGSLLPFLRAAGIKKGGFTALLGGRQMVTYESCQSAF